MKTLDRYIFLDFLTAFFSSLVVVTFVISLSFIIKIVDLIAKGIPWRPVVTILLAAQPTALGVAIPVSALCSCMLVFGRMSDDGEVVAMRTSGMSLWRIARMPLLVAFLLTVLAFYVDHFLEPAGHFLRRSTQSDLQGLSAVDLLDEGRFQRFQNATLYVGQRNGQDLENVRIFDHSDGKSIREIRAKRGRVDVSDSGTDLVVDLYDVAIDPFEAGRLGAAYMKRWRWVMPGVLRRGWYEKNEDDLNLVEIIRRVRELDAGESGGSEAERGFERLILVLKISRRTAMALSPFALVLAGIPLGIRVHRRESSIGVVLSLGLVFSYYMILTLAESLVAHPRYRPDLIVWLPVVLAFGAGLVLMRRAR